MNWTELLKGGIEYNYAVTEKLMKMVDDTHIGWKPSTGSNWMTTGQLLRHLSDACGVPCKGFVTGDWGMPPDVDPSQMKPEDMLPPAEKMPTVTSVAKALELLAEDKALAHRMVDQAGEERLAGEVAPAPWDNMELMLGQRLMQMVEHLATHKAQLFYYLKLKGTPVNTGHLWGVD